MGIISEVKQLWDLQQEKKHFDGYFNEKKAKLTKSISNHMFVNYPADKSFCVDIDANTPQDSGLPHRTIKVVKVKRKQISWNIGKLKKALPKSMLPKVIEKSYNITDMKGLTTYLKSCGVDPKEFKKYIHVTESVNEKAFDSLYSTGKIKMSDVRGCYEIQTGEPYLRLSQVESDD